MATAKVLGYPVADVRGNAAIVGVVRGADPGELAVVGVLVAVKPLPIAVWVLGERIGDIHQRGLRLQKAQRKKLRRAGGRTSHTAAPNERAA